MSKKLVLLSSIILIVSILVTLVFWLALPDSFSKNESSDYFLSYKPVALNILEGRGITQSDGTLAIRYPPGFPLILAGLFWISRDANIPVTTILSLFNLLCMALASLVIFLIVESTFGISSALIASIVWITYPFNLWLTKQPNGEIPFILVLFFCIYLFWNSVIKKQRNWLIYLLVGFLVGISMLIRPISVGMGIVLALVLCLIRRDVKLKIRLFWSTIIIISSFLTVCPWEMLVHAKYDRIILLSSGGDNSMKDGLTFAVNTKGRKSYRKGTKVPADVNLLMKRILENSKSIETVGDIVSLLRNEFRENPLTVGKLFALKASRSWYATDSNRMEKPALLIQFIYLFLILWSSISTWRKSGIARDFAILLWCITLYFWGMTTLVLSIVRYMTPAIGLLLCLTPIAIERIISITKHRFAPYHRHIA